MATIKTQQKISACLWYDNNAEVAAKFYTGIFKRSKITHTSYYGEGAPLPKGTILTVAFQLEGQEFLALNGGPIFKFTEAVSFIIHCKDQEEIDYFWSKLSKGGSNLQCGWLKDKFGLSWQVVPNELTQLMTGDPKRSANVMGALMKMKKLNISKLKKAYNGK